MLKDIEEILSEILPRELEDYFNITDKEKIEDFIYDVCADLEDNLNFVDFDD